MGISGHNLQTFAYPALRTRKSPPLGSTLKVERNLAGQQSRHQERLARIGKLFGMSPLLEHQLEMTFARALSEVLGTPLPYDDILSLRDRLWEISPTLVRYDTLEPISSEVASLGNKELTSRAVTSKASNTPFLKPISNFYQTDVVSRA